MDILYFSLFFAALLVAYVLVHIRLARFEGYLQEVAGLKLLNERLKAVSEVIERVRLDRVEDALAQLHEDAGATIEALGRLEDTLHRDLSHPPQPKVIENPVQEPTSGEKLRDTIRHHLFALGYGDVKIVSELADARLDETYEVRVECSRERMPHKGSVVVQNGGVTDVRLQSAAQSFP